MNDKLMEQVMAEVIKKMGNQKDGEEEMEVGKKPVENVLTQFGSAGMTEFVGTAEGDTIGLVIANVDAELLAAMNIGTEYKSIGIIGARTGAGPQVMAADEAVKATNTEVVTVELPRDTKGGAGHGSLIVFGAHDVSDARRAVEVTLKELDRTFGDVYGNDAGHVELQYTARASHALEKAFGAKIGQAFGIIVGAPAAIGLIMADTAVKSATVDVISYGSPASAPYPNECTLLISGDSGAVRQAVLSAKEVGVSLLSVLGGEEAVSVTTPYI